ncbi:hypothetical protein BSI_08180 [Bacillus inaquosorum KCTC 13429]|uniref:Uncharacterized protein n=1 Tax=Bacillus inaquosorum KCTC 13429 TaxID=1236548 RepID=A0A9W5LMH4_9BACI|nr:hypothetical protein BSI_08180 [Bacillus inaquosorum KCTC 13429]
MSYKKRKEEVKKTSSFSKTREQAAALAVYIKCTQQPHPMTK